MTFPHSQKPWFRMLIDSIYQWIDCFISRVPYLIDFAISSQLPSHYRREILLQLNIRCRAFNSPSLAFLAISSASHVNCLNPCLSMAKIISPESILRDGGEGEMYRIAFFPLPNSSSRRLSSAVNSQSSGWEKEFQNIITHV